MSDISEVDQLRLELEEARRGREYGAEIPDGRPVVVIDAEELYQLRLALQEAQALAERLKLEAQIHAQEARTQKSTVHEIYQLVSGGNGEMGDWNGAEPVRKFIDTQKLALQESQQRVKELERLSSNFDIAAHKTIEGAETVIQELAEALDNATTFIRSMDLDSDQGEDEKCDLLESIRTAEASAAPWLRKEGEK